MGRFAIVYRPGGSWLAGRHWNEQGLYEHGVYMQSLFDAGQLIYGGPFDDHTGGLAVLEVEHQDDAERILREDPAVIDGTFQGEVHPWLTVFDKPENTSAFQPRD